MTMDPSTPRLIEVDFPLEQTSLDSVHEKNVRHGHLSTLHIWPARRPLAACRAALIATLLPAPAGDEERKEYIRRLGGRVVKQFRKKKLPNGRVEMVETRETEGGILHWGRENGPDLDWFRTKIREAYGGRAPRVLDPFAGGGAIPLEAMRLGCEATAVDINPVAWLILKCTLEYPQRLAGKRLPLPHFALESPEFMEGYLSGRGKPARKKALQIPLDTLQQMPDADLAWHVRAWGWWILQRAKADLERFYPVVDGKSTVAYLWARTVTCKHCRATIPLLKTTWLCKKEKKRVRLTLTPNAGRTGVEFGVESGVPLVGGNGAQRRENDKRLGQGTMSRKGVWCICCGKPGTVSMTSEDIRREAQTGRMDSVMTAVVVEGSIGVRKGADGGAKSYRIPTEDEQHLAAAAAAEVERVFADIPFGIPCEPVAVGASRSGGGSAFTAPVYGLDCWSKLFTSRQLLALGTFAKYTRAVRRALHASGVSLEWAQAISAELSVTIDKLADRQSALCRWDSGYSKVSSTFTRFALPILWDYCEANPLSNATGNYASCLNWVAETVEHVSAAVRESPSPQAHLGSVISVKHSHLHDCIVTDPPYYDAIPYSDLMDFFYVWLRRTVWDTTSEIDEAFSAPLGPKWDYDSCDGELTDDAGRFGGDRAKSKMVYEDGMFRAFQACYAALKPEGRLVIVFAHKQPDAWETLVSGIIRAGFVVDASWPIQTEMGNRSRAHESSALSSSVWLVCRKRAPTARPGWDTKVLEEMRDRIGDRLRGFWDAGIRGPDFVWAATGPAMEAYSQHPVVKKADSPGETLGVSEFLKQVRRIVVEFAVGRVLSRNGSAEGVADLDEVTAYYLLHRHSFAMKDAPSGACILFAVSCNLSERALVEQYDLLARSGGMKAAEQDEDDEDGDDDEVAPEEATGTGSTMRLKPWNGRKRPGLGYDVQPGVKRSRTTATLPEVSQEEAPGTRRAPLIDQAHRLMQIWKAGDQVDVNRFLEEQALRRNALFHRLVQALIELADEGSEERSLLEAISNHLSPYQAATREAQLKLEITNEAEADNVESVETVA